MLLCSHPVIDINLTSFKMLPSIWNKNITSKCGTLVHLEDIYLDATKM